MPLGKGYSREVVSKNIHEMVRAGHKPRQAIAAALANARKYKKMAEGGMVEPEDEMLDKGPEDYQRTLGQISRDGDYHPQDVANPAEMDEDADIAAALRRQVRGDLGLDGEAHFAMGGLVVAGPEEDSPVGAKPEEDMASESEEPMGSMPAKPDKMEHAVPKLTDAAMAAIEERKKKRRFMR